MTRRAALLKVYVSTKKLIAFSRCLFFRQDGRRRLLHGLRHAKRRLRHARVAADDDGQAR